LQAKTDLLQRLDAEQYASEEVVILRLPVSLPYAVHQPDFAAANGEVEYKGQYYNMVKQKVKNDTLFMVCIKDMNRSRLENAINEYTNGAVSNLPASTGDAMDILGKLFKDYTITDVESLLVPFQIASKKFSAPTDFMATSPLQLVESPPPQV
jgi:hypothetical protein